MNRDLATIEKNSLFVLDKILYALETREESESNKDLTILFGDIDLTIFKKPEDINGVAYFLRKKGIDFNITFEIEHNDPVTYLDEKHPNEDSVKLGYVREKDWNILRRKIIRLRKEFLGEKTNRINIGTSSEIRLIEVLKDATTVKMKTVLFINSKYDKELRYTRKKYWEMFYRLAINGGIEFEKGFFDYFNCIEANPLYAKEGFKVTKLLKKENDLIVPNIPITWISQRKLTSLKKT